MVDPLEDGEKKVEVFRMAGHKITEEERDFFEKTLREIEGRMKFDYLEIMITFPSGYRAGALFKRA